MASIKYWVWLSAQTGVSPAATAALLRHYGDAETAFFAPAGEFGRIKGISAGDAAVLESRDMSRVEDILAYLGRHTLDIYAIHYFMLLMIRLSIVDRWLEDSGNLLLSIIFTMALSLVVALMSALVGQVLRRSDIIRKYLLGS